MCGMANESRSSEDKRRPARVNKAKPQTVHAKQVQQFLADAQKRVRTARRNLAIDAEIAFQIAYEAMIKGSLALMLSHGSAAAKVARSSHCRHRIRAEKPAWRQS